MARNDRIKVAINGFGRIGRNILRSAKRHGAPIDFVAVNDLTDNVTLAHLLKYDSVHGTYPGTVEATSDGITVDGDEVRVFAEKDPANLPRKAPGVDVDVESPWCVDKREAAATLICVGDRPYTL